MGCISFKITPKMPGLLFVMHTATAERNVQTGHSEDLHINPYLILTSVSYNTEVGCCKSPDNIVAIVDPKHRVAM